MWKYRAGDKEVGIPENDKQAKDWRWKNAGAEVEEEEVGGAAVVGGAAAAGEAGVAAEAAAALLVAGHSFTTCFVM